MNHIPSAIWAAIRNEAGDNLDEDEDYCDGTVGDVINVDAVNTRSMQPDCVALAEELEVEVALRDDAHPSNEHQHPGELTVVSESHIMMMKTRYGHR